MVPGPAKVRTLCVGRRMGLRMGSGGGPIWEDQGEGRVSPRGGGCRGTVTGTNELPTHESLARLQRLTWRTRKIDPRTPQPPGQTNFS